MIRECFKTNSGIIFKKDSLRKLGLEVDTLHPYVERSVPAPIPPPMGKILPPRLPSFMEHIQAFFGASKYPQMPENLPDKEHDIDVWDAVAPLYDQLVLKGWMWGAMEFMHFPTWSRSEGKIVWKRNKASGRTLVPVLRKGMSFTAEKVAKVHWTVRTRMAALYSWEDRSYTPAAVVQGRPFVLTDVPNEDGSMIDELIEWVV